MRWVSLGTLSDETGVPTRTLNEILRREPGLLVARTRHGKRQYQQPTCAIALREREARKIEAKVKAQAERAPDPALAALEIRKRQADVLKREARLGLELKQLTTVSACEQILAEHAQRVRAVIMTAPARYARLFPELPRAQALERLQQLFDAIALQLQRDEDSAADNGTGDNGARSPVPSGNGNDVSPPVASQTRRSSDCRARKRRKDPPR